MAGSPHSMKLTWITAPTSGVPVSLVFSAEGLKLSTFHMYQGKRAYRILVSNSYLLVLLFLGPHSIF